jgi:L-alanine-DL-glutamate epimerase-like enolase superfamily enzyme
VKNTAVRAAWLRAPIPPGALAASHGLTMAPHLWGGAILFASGLHLAVATPCVTTLEFSRGENPLLHDLVEEPVELVDGHVLAPDRPGLGLTLRRDFVRSITVPA